jgi:nitrate reductase NapD
MNIAGVVVRAHPDHLAVVRRALGEMPGVEVHAANADGRLVVTVEGDNEGALADTFREFNELQGVLSASMVYHHFEPELGQES